MYSKKSNINTGWTELAHEATHLRNLMMTAINSFSSSPVNTYSSRTNELTCSQRNI
jgi:hypothetical protein